MPILGGLGSVRLDDPGRPDQPVRRWHRGWSHGNLLRPASPDFLIFTPAGSPQSTSPFLKRDLRNTLRWCGDPPLGSSHGVSDADILHAVEDPLVVVDVDPDADPPKVLVIGADLSSNLLELFVLELADDRLLTIHAMPLRRSFHDLLPKPEDRDA